MSHVLLAIMDAIRRRYASRVASLPHTSGTYIVTFSVYSKETSMSPSKSQNRLTLALTSTDTGIYSLTATCLGSKVVTVLLVPLDPSDEGRLRSVIRRARSTKTSIRWSSAIGISTSRYLG